MRKAGWSVLLAMAVVVGLCSAGVMIAAAQPPGQKPPTVPRPEPPPVDPSQIRPVPVRPQPSGKPDLKVGNLRVSKEATDGRGNRVVELKCDVTNIGTASTGAFEILALIDGTPPRAIHPQHPNPFPHPGLPPANTRVFTVHVPLKDFSAPGGRYYAPNPAQHKYACIADHRKQVAESDESNHEGTAAFTYP